VLGNHTVDLIAPRPKGLHGDPLPTDPDEVQVSGCYMQQASTVENTDGRNTVVSVWDLFLPPGVTVTALHRVRWRGDLYEVDGDPTPWDDGQSVAHHVEVRLRRVTG
jgi:hypothetical protein